MCDRAPGSVGGLEVDDPTARTEILEATSEVYGHLNRVRAALDGRRHVGPDDLDEALALRRGLMVFLDPEAT